MNAVSVSEARSHFAELLDRAEKTHERIPIAKHGRVNWFLVSAEDLEAMDETVYWQAEPDIDERLATARAEVERGEVFTVDQARKILG